MTYATDNVLEDFYTAVLDNKQWPHIPRSDVFYVRNAIEADTGVRYSLDRVERAMYLEGHLSSRDVLDPERVRDWET